MSIHKVGAIVGLCVGVLVGEIVGLCVRFMVGERVFWNGLVVGDTDTFVVGDRVGDTVGVTGTQFVEIGGNPKSGCNSVIVFPSTSEFLMSNQVVVSFLASFSSSWFVRLPTSCLPHKMQCHFGGTFAFLSSGQQCEIKVCINEM